MSILSAINEFRASCYYGGACGSMLSGKHNDALKKIEKAISLVPEGEENSLYVACLGEVYMRLKQFDKAIPILKDTLDRMEIEMKTPPTEWEMDRYATVSEHFQYCRTQRKNSDRITNVVKMEWEHRFPNLTENWTHWKMLGDGDYLDLIDGKELTRALVVVENNFGKYRSIKVCRVSVDENGNLKEEEKALSEISRYIYEKNN